MIGTQKSDQVTFACITAIAADLANRSVLAPRNTAAPIERILLNFRFGEILLKFVQIPSLVNLRQSNRNFTWVHKVQLWCVIVTELYELDVVVCVRPKNSQRSKNNSLVWLIVNWWRYIGFYKISTTIICKSVTKITEKYYSVCGVKCGKVHLNYWYFQCFSWNYLQT
jgi:hypothetical protein